MSYCRVHDGLHYEYEDGCPKCRDDAEQAASDRSEIIRGLARSREESREDLAAAAVYIADAKNNPGEYYCPHCKFRTLKKGASRCPSCHGEPGLQYWVDVETKERDAKLRVLAAEAEMSRLKTQTARISASVPECQLMDIPDEPTDHSDSIAVCSALLFLWLLPFLIAKVFLLNHAQQGDSPPPAFILLIPALNWIGLLFSFPWLSGGFGVAVKTIGGAIGVSVGTTWFARWQFNSLKKEREEVIKKNDQRKLDRKTEIAKLLRKEEAEQNAK